VLNTLRFEEEIQPQPEVAAGSAKKSAAAAGKELQMALKLVEEMTEPWKPEVFENTYRNDLMKRIQEKIKSGQTHALTEPEGDTREKSAGGGKVVDLMSLLQKSLEQKGSAPAQGAAAERGSKRKHSAARRRSSVTRAARRA